MHSANQWCLQCISLPSLLLVKSQYEENQQSVNQLVSQLTTVDSSLDVRNKYTCKIERSSPHRF